MRLTRYVSFTVLSCICCLIGSVKDENLFSWNRCKWFAKWLLFGYLWAKDEVVGSVAVSGG